MYSLQYYLFLILQSIKSEKTVMTEKLITYLKVNCHTCERADTVVFNLVNESVVWGPDNAIHWINHYPVDKCKRNKPCYSLNTDLSSLKNQVQDYII